MTRISLPMIGMLILSLLISGCAAPASSQGTKIRIGVDPKLPPFESTQGSLNEYTGFDIDVMNAIAQKGGFEFEFFNAGSNLVTLVGQCKLEAGISALPYLAESKQVVDFSEPYFTAGLQLVVKKGNITIGGRDQLAGMTVGVWGGTPAESELAKTSSALPKIYPNLDLAFRDLANGYIDAIIADAPRAASFAAVSRNNLKLVGPEFGGQEYGIITCKDQTELLGKINTGLAAVKSDGSLERLTQKWGASRMK